MGIKRIIYLQKIGNIDQSILSKLKKNLAWVYKDYIDGVEILPEKIPLLKIWYNELERKYITNEILNFLENHFKNEEYFRVLGVLSVDIQARGKTFVFGSAYKPKTLFLVDHGLALISINRLYESIYLRPEDLQLQTERTVKEAIHEIGHTFALEHCDKDCVMKFSEYVTDVDEKPPTFCNSCKEHLDKFKK